MTLSFILYNSYPTQDRIFERMAHFINDVEFQPPPLQCSTTTSRELQQSDTERLTKLFYKIYGLPMFTLDLSCCRMPEEKEIATVWRRNIDRLKNFLHLVDTGAVGSVRTAREGRPLREAYIRLIDHVQIYNVTKNLAYFQLILPEGDYAIEVIASNFQSEERRFHVKRGEITNLGMITLNAFTVVTGHSELITSTVKDLSHPSSLLTGFVLDINNHPIAGAKVMATSSSNTSYYIQNYTDHMGLYILSPVLAGKLTINVEASHHQSASRLVQLRPNGKPVSGVVFHLQYDSSMFGMPRMVFIIMISLVLIFGMLLCLMCGQCMWRRYGHDGKSYYTFSLLPTRSKELFDDEDYLSGNDGKTETDGETVLFRSPIKSKYNHHHLQEIEKRHPILILV